LSLPGLTHGCPVNFWFTIGSQGVAVRWSMRSWESVRRGADRRQGFPGSHGPSNEELTATRLSSGKCPAAPPGNATALVSRRSRQCSTGQRWARRGNPRRSQRRACGRMPGSSSGSRLGICKSHAARGPP
jgi:hypothetical protein